MAAKKKGSGSRKKPVTKKKKKTARSKKSSQPPIFKELKKAAAVLAVLMAVVLTGAMIADILFDPGGVRKSEKRETVQVPEQEQEKEKPEVLPEPQPPVVKEKKRASGLKEKAAEEQIAYEVFEEIAPVVIREPVKQIKDKVPRVAIIIDDIGYDKKIALALCDLNPNITFSVLPFSPFGKKIAHQLNQKGAELMLHLPMEPVEYPRINPGPGAILSEMSPDILIAQLKRDLVEVPNARGVNNHMGSRMTANEAQMNQIFSILKKKDLFFIDSRTAPKSRCRAAARLLRLKFAARDVFLDNIQEHNYIKGQLKELVDLAEKHGTAIGIGHPYKATLETLSTELIRLQNKVKIVRASTLVDIPG